MNNNFKILGFTDYRSTELKEPLDSVNNASVITAPNISGPQKYTTLYQLGKQQIQSERPNVLVSNHPGRLGITVLLLGNTESIPVVVRIAGDMWRTNFNVLKMNISNRSFAKATARVGQMLLNKILISKADGFIVVSEELKQIVSEKADCPLYRVCNIPIPINASKYRNGSRHQGRKRLGVETEKLLLTVTNLRFRGKLEGIQDSVRAIIPILATNPEITYAIVGNGPYLGPLQSFVDQTVPESLQERIIVHGFDPDIIDIYSAADIFVYLSYIDGYPNVILEAMAAELPIITNADHGMIEQINHNRTGILIDDPLEKNLSRAIKRLLLNPEFGSQLGKRAYQCVKTRNNSARVGDLLTMKLEEIIWT